MTYQEAQAILDNCPHPHMSSYNPWCTDCWNAYVAAYRQARKAELAEYWAKQPKCDCCGERPFRWYWASFRLCTQCKNLLVKEHNRNLARYDSMAAVVGIATGGRPLISTEGWAATKEG